MKTYKVHTITDFNHQLMMSGSEYDTQTFVVQAQTKEEAEEVVEVEQEVTSFKQVKTRLQSFVEML